MGFQDVFVVSPTSFSVPKNKPGRLRWPVRNKCIPWIGGVNVLGKKTKGWLKSLKGPRRHSVWG